MLKCKFCETELNENDLFCKNCGNAVKKPSKKLSVISLIFAILSAFYAFCILWADMVYTFVNSFNSAMKFGVGFYHYGAIALVLICAAISLICSNISIKRGYKTKATKFGQILCIISLSVMILGTVLALIIL